MNARKRQGLLNVSDQHEASVLAHKSGLRHQPEDQVQVLSEDKSDEKMPHIV